MSNRSTLTTLFTATLLSLVAGCDTLSALNPFGGGGTEEVPPAVSVAPVPTAPADPAAPTDQTPTDPAAPPTAQAPAAAPNVPPSQTPFRDAVNKAMEAANAVQTAKTSAEWQNVTTLWQTAIALMQQVPEGDPNHAVAQQKVTEYTQYLQYAQQNSTP
ncbi:hypothetical protein [Spirulina sp. 06S082]|uniref:hypothetical protein n=1 Tax=Spirulina sp. 06S082 TaxID=3110248 RepID=UPI002B1F3C17|nr:hypothetical protein [Spirulina sp. 06S082]MEA5467759.1 hypothetical protein [Spirulina sp. 06S082]